MPRIRPAPKNAAPVGAAFLLRSALQRLSAHLLLAQMPKLGCQPSTCRHAPAHMRAMRFGRHRPFPPVTQVVAVQTRSNDVVGCVSAPFRTGVKMLSRALQDFRQSARLATDRQTGIWGFIPYGEVAVKTAAPLFEHLLTTQVLKCFHGTGTPFDFMRSECATSQGDAPRQEAYARARPDYSWFRSPDSET